MCLSQKSLKSMRGIILGITPEITVLLDEYSKINKLRANADEANAEEATRKGIEVIIEILDMFLVRQYDCIIKIIASLYEIKPSVLEDKTVEEISNMIFDTLTDETLQRLFPQLRLLAQKS